MLPRSEFPRMQSPYGAGRRLTCQQRKLRRGKEGKGADLLEFDAEGGDEAGGSREAESVGEGHLALVVNGESYSLGLGGGHEVRAVDVEEDPESVSRAGPRSSHRRRGVVVEGVAIAVEWVWSLGISHIYSLGLPCQPAVGTGPVRFWEPLAGDRSGPVRFWDTRIGTGPVRSGFETTEDRSGPVTGPVWFW